MKPPKQDEDHGRRSGVKRNQRATVRVEDLAYSNMLSINALVELLEERGILPKGEKDQALALLETAYQQRNGWLAWLQARRTWDPLRSDPRFQDLLRRMNFPE